MKYLKEFSKFSDDDKEIFSEIVDIFSYVEDYNLCVDDVYRGNALSIGDKDIIHNHQALELSSIFKSISIRLKPKTKGDFYFDEELYSELKDALKRVESYLGLELNSIYLRTFDGVWFNSIDVMKKYIDELPFAKKSILRHILYIDFTFKDLNEINESKKYEIEHHLDDILDIFREYADEYDLKYVDNFDNTQQFFSGDLDNCYTLRFPSKSSWCASIEILFDEYFGSAGVDGYLGEDFQMDIHEFIRRLKSLDLDCEIDWSGGSSYTIDIYGYK